MQPATARSASEALAEFETARGAVIGERSATGELIDTHELEVPGANAVRTYRGLSVTAGLFAETNEWVGGYCIIDVASEEDCVIEIAARFGEARCAPVEVRALILPPLFRLKSGILLSPCG